MKNNSNNKKPHFSYLKIKHPFLGKSDLLFLKSLKIIVLKSEWFRLHSRYSFFFFSKPSWTLSRQPCIMWISEKHVAKTKAVLVWHSRESQHRWTWCSGPEAPPAPRFSPFRQLGGKAPWNSPFTLWAGTEHPTLSLLFLSLTVRGI